MMDFAGDASCYRQIGARAMETISESSGNVFADLDFSPEESALLAMRAGLIARLRETYRRTWLGANGSRRPPRHRAIPGVRPGARQVGEVQPRHAAHAGGARRPHRGGRLIALRTLDSLAAALAVGVTDLTSA